VHLIFGNPISRNVARLRAVAEEVTQMPARNLRAIKAPIAVDAVIIKQLAYARDDPGTFVPFNFDLTTRCRSSPA